MFTLKNKYRLQWIFIICFLSSIKVIKAQVSLTCIPGYPTYHETADIAKSVTDCTVTGGDTVTIKSQTPSSSFTLKVNPDDPTIFGLYFLYQPDFETTSSYLVTLVGSQDSTNSPPVDLNVNIVDDDDNDPYFNMLSTTFAVDENTKDLDVTQLSVKDADGSTTFDYSSVTLAFADSNDYGGTFGLSSITVDDANKQAVASLTLLKELDYETIVSYSLLISATDGGGLSVNTNIVVNVNDVEDTPPYFTNTATYTEINEDAAAGSTVLRVQAIDGDRGINHPVTYSIILGDPNGDFAIDPTSGLVTVKNALDRDAGTPLYILTILATETDVTDETVPYETNTNSTISLMDVNDSPPQFTAKTYTASVPENSAPGFLVTFDAGQVFSVSDIDSDTYAVFDVTLSDPSNSFTINPLSGTSQQTFTILVNDGATLDYETVPSLEVTVTAVDSGNPGLTDSATITIAITDANDTPPKINAITCTPTPEDAGIGTTLCTVDASNSDPTFATLLYSGNFGQLDGKVDIDPGTGIITVTADDAFDYEYVKSYTFTIYVYNDNGAGLAAHLNGQLDILDVNDNKPTFQPEAYQVSLNEGDADFAVPLVVQATDLDSDVNAELTFTITDGSQYFSLSDVSSTNKIYSQTIVPIAPLDYETVSSCTSQDGCPITISVVATDGGNPALTSTATVTVQLMDINDNPPEFGSTSYTGSVSEDSAAGTSVTTVSATDADLTAKYNTFSFRLQNDGAANFVIDATSGLITTSDTSKLNPNLYTPVKYSYNLTVYASDGAHEPSCSVIVSIVDVDNNPPAFDNQGVFTGSLNENDTSYMTTPFAFVTATDPDSAPDLVYSIDFESSVAKNTLAQPVDVDLSLWFTIEPPTGNLLIVQAIDREIFDSADLALVVTDANTAAGEDSDTGSIIIQINDVNDNPPDFKQAQYEASVPEESTNTIVTMADQVAILAADQDRDFSVVTYSIDDETYFQIAENTGIISTSSTPLDHETTKYVLLTMTATDNGDPALSSTATINITVIDINDSQPSFDGIQSFDFDEDTTGVAGTMHATDADDGVYGTLCYTFDPSTESEYGDTFAIGRDSGNISLSKAIDYDTSPNYDPENQNCPYVLTVLAMDNCQGGPGKQYTDSTTATVNIQPTNDFDPEITFNDYQSVPEDSPPGFVIVTATATDADKGPDGAPFHFTLADDSGHFKIDEAKGVVTLVNNVTDQIQTFSVTVTACDDSSTQRCSDQPFSIEITDVNNHPPIINNLVTEFHVDAWNCTLPGDLVVTVTYFDSDADVENRNTKFTSTCKCILNDDPDDHSAFVIDPNSGDLTINVNLDETGCVQYQVDVTVTNVNDATETSTTPFIMNVDNCIYTDNPPVFNESRTEYQNWPESCSTSTCPSHNYTKPVELDHDDQDNNIPIYCYITDGNIDDTFWIDPEECAVSIAEGKSLDFETHSSYQLVLFASEDIDRPVQTIPYDVKNKSLALLNVIVGDVNDNVPYFDPNPFYSGVSSSNQIGDVIAVLTAYDVDTVDADALTYSNGDVKVTNKKKMESVTPDCIIINSNGEITLNYAFTDSMTGYIEFVATVKDSDELHSNTTDVKIYVVSSDEKLVCYASKTVGEFQNITRDFERDFSAATGYNVVVDGVQPHTDLSDNDIPSQCEVIIHMVDAQNNILSADDAMGVVTKNNDELFSVVFPNYGVFQIQAWIQPTPAEDNNTTEYILIAVAAVLGVLAIALIILSIFNSRRMKRKLKAATAPAFVSQNSGLNRVGVPNSNLHAIEGSNPIWNQKTNVEQNLDETSDNASIISLDVINDKKFEGGLNNPTFEQRIENYFNEDNNYADKNSLNSEKSDFNFEDRNSLRDDRNSLREDRNSIREDRNSFQDDRNSFREDRNSFREDRNNAFEDDRNSFDRSLRNELI